MKAFFLLVLVGASTAMFSGSGSGGLFSRVSGAVRNSMDRLQNVDISDFSLVRGLFQAQGTAQDIVLQAAANSFLLKFKDSVFLADKPRSEIMRNFIENAKDILTQPLNPDWTPGLDMEILALSKQEFLNLLALRPPANRNSSVGQSVTSSRQKRQTVPKSIDWRQRGAVTPVKNQGKCGSCWAFAAVGAMEGRIAVKTGKLPVLSEQFLVDCAKNVGDSKCCKGCDGGWMTDGFTYITENEGISSEQKYPYEAKDLQCRYNEAHSEGSTKGFEYTKQDDEEDLMRAVAQGPVAVAVDATRWNLYKSGIFKCRVFTTLTKFIPLTINHGVVVVGYGSSVQGDYWIVKNSWGPSWGEQGYIRIARNSGNQCGIAGSGSYPTP